MNIPEGAKVTCVIQGVKIADGRIHNKGSSSYVCQNEKWGYAGDTKYGYRHSWQCGSSTRPTPEEWGVHELKVIGLIMEF